VAADARVLVQDVEQVAGHTGRHTTQHARTAASAALQGAASVGRSAADAAGRAPERAAATARSGVERADGGVQGLKHRAEMTKRTASRTATRMTQQSQANAARAVRSTDEPRRAARRAATAAMTDMSGYKPIFLVPGYGSLGLCASAGMPGGHVEVLGLRIPLSAWGVSQGC
jgi:hypothetical protein